MFDVLVSLGRPWSRWPARTAVRRAAAGPGSALVPPLGTFVTAATMLCLSLGAVAGRWLGWQAALGSAAVIYLVAGIGVLLTRHRQPGPPPCTRPGASYLAGVPLVLPYSAPGIGTTARTRRAGEERRRIARELHDSLTHNITLITVQAGIAVHLARQRGEPVPTTRCWRSRTPAGEAMRELRATLAVLRGPPTVRRRSRASTA